MTCRHAEHVLQQQAARIAGCDSGAEAGHVSSIYCIGDNVCTDIFGANLYNRYVVNQFLVLLMHQGGQVTSKNNIREQPDSGKKIIYLLRGRILQPLVGET